jgi:hypothetical protein
MENYDEIWEQVLDNLQLESTLIRHAMLLRCQASIKSIDGADVKLVVSDMWMAMIQTRESIIADAFEPVLGRKCNLHLVPASMEKEASIATPKPILPRRRVWPD